MYSNPLSGDRKYINLETEEFLSFILESIHFVFKEINSFYKGRRQKKKTVKRVTSYIFQITPSLLALRMTSERMTNHNNQWVPPSLRKE